MRFFLLLLLVTLVTPAAHAAFWDGWIPTARATDQLPRIAFDAEPRITGGGVILFWTIRTSASAIVRADVWRGRYSHDCQETSQLGCRTEFVGGKAAPDVAQWSDSINDTLSDDGNYLYVLYVSDREGRVATQSLRVTKSGSAPACADSDGGKDYYVQGTIAACSGNARCRAVIDSCYGAVLSEGFCSGVASSREEYACPNGCADGACIAANGSSVVYLSTDKKTYRISEAVHLSARVEGTRDEIGQLRPSATVKRPDGTVDEVPLAVSAPCGEAQKCTASYFARYDRTNSTGQYAIDGINVNTRTKFVLGTSFEVFGRVEQYLILRNIGNATFVETEAAENDAYAAYFAAYNSSGRLVISGVADYRSEQKLDSDFDEFLRRNADKVTKEAIAGNTVYAFRDSYEHMIVWKRGSRALFVIQYLETKELDIGTALRPPSFAPRPVRKPSLFSDIVSAVNLDPDNGITISRFEAFPARAQSGDIITITATIENSGNRTAHDLAAELIGVAHLWRDARGMLIEDTQPQGPFVLRPPSRSVPGDMRTLQWKIATPQADGKTQYQITVGVTYAYETGERLVADRSIIVVVDGTASRSRPQPVLPLVTAYLEKYPSDFTESECEAKGGYCSFSNSCKKGYVPLAYSCAQETCCARALTIRDVLAMRDRIESIAERLGRLSDKAAALADRYQKLGDDAQERSYRTLSDAAAEARKTATQLLEGLIRNPERTEEHRRLFSELKAQAEKLAAGG